jgi:glucose/arabinose dehydrogenase
MPPQAGFGMVKAFPTMEVPIVRTTAAVATPSGETNRLFIVEKQGVISVITNLTSPTRAIFLDITDRVFDTWTGENGLLGLAFHPGYRTNGYFYVFYTRMVSETLSMYDRLSRFTVSATDENVGLKDSELVLIDQFDRYSNHNGGDLHFGPDGYLYVSLGDEGAPNDGFDNAQTITNNFFSGILRIDVDRRVGSLAPNPHPAASTNYAIPPDNPFVGITNFNGNAVIPEHVRTEFWAIGLRNPWRMSFDKATGNLYCGDVGEVARDEIDIIIKGGNYGWAFREGTVAGPKPAPAGVQSIDPIYQHYRSAIIGGVVYHGDRLPGLDGAYIFGDLDNRLTNILALRQRGTNYYREPIAHSGSSAIAAFGIDPANGDILICHAISPPYYLSRLAYNVPRKLVDTGIFADLEKLAPNEGVIPYEVNLPSWADGATSRRWFMIPTNATAGAVGSVFVQHLELEMTNGVSELRRRLETRILVADDAGGAYGVTYRWGESLSEAEMVPIEGLDETLFIQDAGTVRTQRWHYPSRAECVQCHRGTAFVLAFNPFQLNRDVTYPNGVTENQLTALRRLRYLDSSPYTDPAQQRSLASLTNEDVSVEYRARSYLAVNCSPCHSSSETFDTRLLTQTASSGMINGSLHSSSEPDMRVLVPGSLELSMLLHRMTSLGTNRMPPVTSTLLDTQAIALISYWVTNDLPKWETYDTWSNRIFGSLVDPLADSDHDGAPNQIEYFTGTDPRNPLESWRFTIVRSDHEVDIMFPRVPNRSFEIRRSNRLTGLFERLPVAENRPFFSATNGVTRVRDPIVTDNQRFYRMWISSP